MVDHSHQTIALALIVVLSVVSTVIFALRLVGLSLQKRFGIEDGLIACAWVISVIESYLSWRFVIYMYIGYHNKDMPKDWATTDLEYGLHYYYGIELTHNIILSLVKASALIFLDRINGNQIPKIRYAIRGAFLLNASIAIIFLIALIFQCSPISYAWTVANPATKHGKCVDQGVLYTIQGVLIIVTDIFVLSLPACIVYNLHMRLRQKIAVTCLLSLGLIVTLVGCIRLKTVIHHYFQKADPDGNWDISFIASTVEVDVAIMTACGPSLKPLMQRWLPRLLGSSYKTSERRGISQTYGRTPKSGTTHQKRSKSGTMVDYEMGKYQGKKLHSTTTKGDGESEQDIIPQSGITKTMSVNVKIGDSSETMVMDSDRRRIPGIGIREIDTPPKGGKSTAESVDSLV
ncbi:MAG: hypothetical protein M1834_008412 [Cirrosporium novae-zelandiae]|nr:MAG: hypothetical protein M1834_008412 [Cirrosporium novae-zelandiae]